MLSHKYETLPLAAALAARCASCIARLSDLVVFAFNGFGFELEGTSFTSEVEASVFTAKKKKFNPYQLDK